MRSSRKVLIFLFLCCAHIVAAQNINVSSFKLLDSDLTSNTTGTMERDQNGEIAALIKVVTTEQGFVFDGGMTGIVKTKQEVGEVWVYVPHGIKKITVKHPQLGVLRDYYFPIPIDKAKTYEMVLATGKVETIVTRSANKQYVIFNVNPANAIVELDGMPLDVSSDGYAEKSMPYGTYSYRISSANYHTEAGQVIVSAQGKSEVSVTLRPNFGWIDVKGANEYHGAHVYVDNEHIGQLPIKSDAIKSGTHQVKVMKSMYKPYEQQVTVTDNETTELNVQLVANFANVTLTTDAESEIWVDGRQRGKGQCILPLEVGDYTVEVKRASHRTVSEVVTISNTTARTIQLASPTPIYGVLDITSTPSRATIYIDGMEVGQTPLIKNDVLIGSHRVTFKKEGYDGIEEFVDVNENADNKLAVTLKEEPSVEAIDLGLSVKWASCNVGATSPEEYGDYFAWGETKTKLYYTESNSVTYGLSTSSLKSRGIIGSDGNLTAAYDAATVNWGSQWRMPTINEIKELYEKCRWTWSSRRGVNGYRVTGPNGKSIFLPAAGYRTSIEINSRGLYGYFWSAAPCEYLSSRSYYLRFYSDNYVQEDYARFIGQAVRPVSDK